MSCHTVNLHWGLGCKGDCSAGWGHALCNLLRGDWLTGVRENKGLCVENDLCTHAKHQFFSVAEHIFCSGGIHDSDTNASHMSSTSIAR